MRTAAASEKGSCKQEQTINTPIEEQSTQQKTKSKSFTEFCENKPSIANDETAEHCPNTSSRSSDSDCGSSSSNELGCSVNVPADSTGLDAPQCDLGERALWHHSNTALEHKWIQTFKLSSLQINTMRHDTEFCWKQSCSNKLQGLYVLLRS